MARLRHAGGHQGCLFIGVERKSPAHPQNDVIDPNRTWRITSIGVAALLVRLTCFASSVIFSCMTLSVDGAGGPLLP